MTGEGAGRRGGEAVELLVALIRDRCVNDGSPDSGQEIAAVETLEGYLGMAGERFEPHPGRTSVVYRVPGRVPGAPALMLMGHTDVVPTDPDGWTHDPFEGVRADGLVWGRGAVDMLNVTAAMAVAFRPYLHGERPPLPGDLVFLAVADEEAGGAFGAEPLVRERWDVVACDALLTEVAYPALDGPAGPVPPVTVGEKGPYWRRMRAEGTPGHGSQPYGTDNPLVPLARAAVALAETPSPVHITDEWRAFVAGLDLEEDLRRDLLDPDRVDDAVDRLAAQSLPFARFAHACTHLTVSPNVLRVGTKANVVPGHGEAEVDIRALPGQDGRTVAEHLDKVLGADRDRLTIEPVMDHPANTSPTSGILWEALGDAYEAALGSRAMLPTLTPVTTDARFFRDRGVVAYGSGLYDDRIGFAEFLTLFHGRDERVSERSVALLVDHYDRVVERFGERSA